MVFGHSESSPSITGKCEQSCCHIFPGRESCPSIVAAAFFALIGMIPVKEDLKTRKPSPLRNLRYGYVHHFDLTRCIKPTSVFKISSRPGCSSGSAPKRPSILESGPEVAHVGERFAREHFGNGLWRRTSQVRTRHFHLGKSRVFIFHSVWRPSG